MANEPNIQSLALELCESLLAQYVETYETKTRDRLNTLIPFCDNKEHSILKARLAHTEGDELTCLKLLENWTDDWIRQPNAPPTTETLKVLLERTSWLLFEHDELDSVGEIYRDKLIKTIRSEHPNTSSSYFLSAILGYYETSEETIAAFETAFRLDPGNYLALRQLAVSYFDALFFEKALASFEGLDRSIGLGTLDPTDLLRLAFCHANALNWSMTEHWIEKYRGYSPTDEDAINMAANTMFKLGRMEEAKLNWMKVIPESVSRKLWIWVTKPEYYEETERIDRLELDPFYLGGSTYWSCDENTETGDLILIYRTRPQSDIAYLLVALDDAEEQEEDSSWDYMCHARVIWKLSPSIKLQELKENPKLDDWSPLKRQFQGTTFQLDREKFSEILDSTENPTTESRYVKAFIEKLV